MDLYGFFKKLYDKQELNIEQIKIKTLSEFNLLDAENKPIYGNEEWLAYALICWECKALDNKTVVIIKNILEDKETIEVEWEDLAEKRIAEIQKLLIKIQTPPKRKKQISKEYIVNLPFQIGDCIVVKNHDNMYNAYIVIDIDKKYIDEPNMWTYFVGTTRIYNKTEPTMEDIINNYFIVLNYGKTYKGENAAWVQRPQLCIYGRLVGSVKNEKERIEIEKRINDYKVIGNINFASLPSYEKSWGGFHLNSENQISSQFEWEKTNPKSIDLGYPIKKYITTNKLNKKSWMFWK